ncbi:uncharacterized protein LOC118749827, partial [Rhagoletis pomonella]|uniref:uncharacterized protein LOC118749827 n=1 Tax=Rhagoletis pomonella TaxID=28610 RepID=UPI00177CF9A3
MQNEFKRQMHAMQKLLVSNTQQLRSEFLQARSKSPPRTSASSLLTSEEPQPAQPSTNSTTQPACNFPIPQSSQTSLPPAPPSLTVPQPAPPLSQTAAQPAYVCSQSAPPFAQAAAQPAHAWAQSAPLFSQAAAQPAHAWSQSATRSPQAAAQPAHAWLQSTQQPYAQAPRVTSYLREESQHSTSSAAKKIYPLPIFSGTPEDWQAFIETFEGTTLEFEYSNLHNIMRLRDALKGRAREAVESLLVNSANVAAILEILRETFGRPEQLIKSQIEKVRSIPPLVDGHLESLVNFANKIANMATFLQNVDGFHHLSNPTLISELVAKLPTPRQMRWAEKCLELERPPTIVDFSNWLITLRRLANIVAYTLPYEGNSRNQLQLRTKLAQGRRTASNNRQYACVSVFHRICPNCEGECGTLNECQSFLHMTSDDRWKQVKALKLCFSCLRKGHRTQQCLSRKSCGKNGCRQVHHHLLHIDFAGVPPRRRGAANASSELGAARPQADAQQHIERRNCHADCYSHNVLFQILPIKLYGRGKVITTYAFVDDGANVSMIDQDLAMALGIRGKAEILELQWLNEQTNTQKAERVTITISGVEN